MIIDIAEVGGKWFQEREERNKKGTSDVASGDHNEDNAHH